MDPYLAHAICQTLLRRGTGDDAVAQLGVNRAEFKKVYHAIEKKLPGVSLDLEKLMSGDPIECDPLIAQGNLAILRFDDFYRETLQAWLASRDAEVTFHKRSVTPGKIQDYSVTKETTEYGGKKALPNESLIDQAVNVTLAAFRIQATITHRREQLLNPTREQTTERDQPVSPTRQRGKDASHQPQPTNHNPDLIGPTESLEPYKQNDSRIRGYQRFSTLKGLQPISGFNLATTPPVEPTLPDERSVTVGQALPDEPSTEDEPSNNSGATADSFSSANCEPTPLSETTVGHAPPDEPSNDSRATTDSEVPKGRPIPARGIAPGNETEKTPSPERAPHKPTANTESQPTAPATNSPREEEPVTPPSATPAPPRDPDASPALHWPPTTSHWPVLLHQRE